MILKAGMRITVVGRLTRDAETRVLPSGRVYCTLSVELNRRFNDASEPQILRVKAWEKLAEAVGELRKKQYVLVNGEVVEYTIDDKIKGTELKASEIIFMDKKSKEE